MFDRMSRNSNWRQFDFSLENEVSSISLSPKKSLPVLQSPLYKWENIVMNEGNEASTKYWIVKRAEYSSDQMQNISRCCWKQKVQLPHHSNCSLSFSRWFASITTAGVHISLDVLLSWANQGSCAHKCVKIFRTVTRNAVNNSTCSWLPLNKHALNIFIGARFSENQSTVLWESERT